MLQNPATPATAPRRAEATDPVSPVFGSCSRAGAGLTGCSGTGFTGVLGAGSTGVFGVGVGGTEYLVLELVALECLVLERLESSQVCKHK